jgi:hypothetical protein
VEDEELALGDDESSELEGDETTPAVCCTDITGDTPTGNCKLGGGRKLALFAASDAANTDATEDKGGVLGNRVKVMTACGVNCGLPDGDGCAVKGGVPRENDWSRTAATGASTDGPAPLMSGCGRWEATPCTACMGDAIVCSTLAWAAEADGVWGELSAAGNANVGGGGNILVSKDEKTSGTDDSDGVRGKATTATVAGDPNGERASDDSNEWGMAVVTGDA